MASILLGHYQCFPVIIASLVDWTLGFGYTTT